MCNAIEAMIKRRTEALQTDLRDARKMIEQQDWMIGQQDRMIEQLDQMIAGLKATIAQLEAQNAGQA